MFGLRDYLGDSKNEHVRAAFESTCAVLLNRTRFGQLLPCDDERDEEKIATIEDQGTRIKKKVSSANGGFHLFFMKIARWVANKVCDKATTNEKSRKMFELDASEKDFEAAFCALDVNFVEAAFLKDGLLDQHVLYKGWDKPNLIGQDKGGRKVVFQRPAAAGPPTITKNSPSGDRYLSAFSLR